MTSNLKFLPLLAVLPLISCMQHRVFSADDSCDFVERIYDHKLGYNFGVFERYKDETALSTHPSPPKKPNTQAALIYNKTNFTTEKVLKKVIPGQDGRKRIQNTTAWPYSIHAHLNMVFDGNDYGGSGVIVGPHHLLTCGHNVYDFNRNFFFQEISVYPALNGNIAPFNKAKVIKAYVFKGWQDRGDKRFDMALLLLDQPIGDYVGWGGLLSTDVGLPQEEVHITGYPGDKGCREMWSMSHKIKAVRLEEFDYDIDTYPGQSGSAIWIKKGCVPMILGIHTLGGNTINSGVRISREKFTKIVDIIVSTSTINIDGLNLVDPSSTHNGEEEQGESNGLEKFIVIGGVGATVVTTAAVAYLQNAPVRHIQYLINTPILSNPIIASIINHFLKR